MASFEDIDAADMAAMKEASTLNYVLLELVPLVRLQYAATPICVAIALCAPLMLIAYLVTRVAFRVLLAAQCFDPAEVDDPTLDQQEGEGGEVTGEGGGDGDDGGDGGRGAGGAGGEEGGGEKQVGEQGLDPGSALGLRARTGVPAVADEK
jgi:hypothetical protein